LTKSKNISCWLVAAFSLDISTMKASPRGAQARLTSPPELVGVLA
jgi:hypothetical protein